MLVEAEFSGLPAPQQRIKAPNLDKDSQCVALLGHAVKQALPHSGGCQQHNPGKQGLCLLSPMLKSYKHGFATLIHPLMWHMPVDHIICLQLQQYRQIKSLRSASIGHTRCCVQRALIRLQNVSAIYHLKGGILTLWSSFGKSGRKGVAQGYRSQ